MKQRAAVPAGPPSELRAPDSSRYRFGLDVVMLVPRSVLPRTGFGGRDTFFGGFLFSSGVTTFDRLVELRVDGR